MLINLFNTVRAYGVPVSLKEFLDLLKALEKQLVFADWNDFYFLSRTILVKDEKYFDKFDRAFDVYFRGIENMDDVLKMIIPEDWIRKEFNCRGFEKDSGLGRFGKVDGRIQKKIGGTRKRTSWWK